MWAGCPRLWPLRPLRAIASSGELARVMLALKTVLVAQDQVPVLVFDEVDANVGGETAKVVGEKLRQISQRRPVLSITHLPQVAARGTHHLRVAKQTHGSFVSSSIEALDEAARIEEIARMLGGQRITATTRQHAAEMLAG